MRPGGAICRGALAAATLALVAACAGPASRAPGATRYAFVVLGVDGEAVARAITTAPQCPAVEIDGVAQPMTERNAPATAPLRPTRSTPALSKPSAFPVRTCDRALPPGTARASVDGRALPLPKANPQRIVLIGDTGCRLKRSDNAFQPCNDPARWPFAAVADAAAATAPDLVVHVGDYHYRENACPDGDAGCAGSPWGYGWDAWEADFFAPAQRLLAAAPWVVVRGNHESCARAGQGWWRFVDPRPPVARRDCDDAADDAIGDYSEPYAVPLGAGTAATAPADADGNANADAQLVVFDSSIVGLDPLPPSDRTYVAYRAQLERAFALAAAKPATFFISHHPVLAFAPNVRDPQRPHPGNAALQSVLDALQPTVLFPPTVQAVLGGHVHLLEIVSFTTAHPPQLVSGNGGTDVDRALPSPFPAAASPAPGAIVAQIVSTTQFGFLTMERQGPGWRLTARDVAGRALTTCALAGRRASCAPLP